MSRCSSKSSLDGTRNEDREDNLPRGRSTSKTKDVDDIPGKPFTNVNGAANLNLGLETEKPMPEIYPLPRL